MRWNALPIALPLLTGTLAGCAHEPVATGAPAFLSAAIDGSIRADYSGTGTFQTLPAKVSGARFSLHSSGTGASTGQGFAFQSMLPPEPGEYPIGVMSGDEKLDGGAFHASYWYDEGGVKRIFGAASGTVRISESTTRRVVGTFRVTARPLYLCTLKPSLAGQLTTCAPSDDEASLEITGSFDAGPLGGESPGLTLYGG